jgi:uracil-DNA glycosylase family 4
MTQGFFTKKQLSRAKEKVAGDPRCMSCGLMDQCNSPQMEVSGRGRKKILIIGEAPGSTEDKYGKPFLGQAGKKLQSELRRQDIDMRKDCWITNAINCMPPYETDKTTGRRELRKPKPNEIDACRPMLFETIESLEPKKIIVVGGTAMDSFLAHRWGEKLGGINVWRGYKIPDREVKAWVFPVYHPSFVMRSEKKRIIQTTFRRDIRQAIRFKPHDIDWAEDFESQVRILTNPEAIEQAILKIIGTNELTSFDYETTGLKPYVEGHKIWSVSIANRTDGAFSFHLLPEIVPVWKKFLASSVPKTAHNAPFEQLWSLVILEQWVNNLFHCSQLAAHTIDNRRRTKSLKFQAYAHFGVSNWAHDIGMKKFLRAKGKDKNAFNKIHKAPQKDLLLYGGLDSLHELSLAETQMEVTHAEAA